MNTAIGLLYSTFKHSGDLSGYFQFNAIKVAVRVISSDPTCKIGNTRFAEVPLKPDQWCENVLKYLIMAMPIFFSCGRNVQVTYVGKPQFKIIMLFKMIKIYI